MLLQRLLSFLFVHAPSPFGWIWPVPKVCYDHVGCFNVSSPFNNANYLFPQSPETIDTRFLLYTRGKTLPENLNPYESSTITTSSFSSSRPTKFIIHGYSDSGSAAWISATKTALLTKVDANVIVVDWSKGADNWIYSQSAANTRVVGATIANLIRALQKLAGFSLADVHMIGHSLGSHIASYAGNAVPGCGRITGLDPAGPLFENEDPLVRLDPTDALFVEAIHTDGEELTDLGFGMQQAVGHADFYPNGGVNQPGCPDHTENVFSSISTSKPLEAYSDGVACSHLRVLDLYIESIASTCVFEALPCKSKQDFDAGRCGCKENCQYATMGYGSLPSNTGTFYLKSNGGKPFCIE